VKFLPAPPNFETLKKSVAMAVSMRYILALLIGIGLWVLLFLPSRVLLAASIALIVVLAFAHRTKKRKSTYDKHTKKRAGEIYDLTQNEKRGTKNKKYKRKPNPNKKENSQD
jgi:membrane protein implicated in regulation of membrane protease activity